MPITDPTSMSNAPVSATFRCPSCAAESLGRFCSHCGEKEITDRDYSLGHFFGEIITAVTLLESRALRSLWLVVTKPGFLSSEYFKGRRVRYVKPLQLFVSLNVVYYFSISLFFATTFTTPLSTQLHMNNYYPGYANARVEHKLQKENITYPALAAKYDQHTNVLSKTLIFLLIPIFAVLFYGFFFLKREYLVQHVVIATHFWSFGLLLLGVFLPLATVLLGRIFRWIHLPSAYLTDDGIISAFLQICIGVYLFLMFRRAYDVTRWYSLLTSSLIAWSFFHIVWLYRFFLFEATLGFV
jgi:hypothetical protein